MTDPPEKRPRKVLQRAEKDMIDGAGHKVRKSLEKSVDAYHGGTADSVLDWRYI